MPTAADEHFERPNCPEWHHDNESFIRRNDPGFLSFLQLEIVAEQTTAVCLGIAVLRRKLARRRLRNGAGRPNLAMRMRIACAHYLAPVLEDLDVADSRHLAELR